jgi:long-chain acyl-CoA synthetase
MTQATQTASTVLEQAYHWEQTTPDEVYLVQPMGGPAVKELTWRQAFDEARRIATYLGSLDLPENSHIALFSKNSAWWILADLAIHMAGHVTIPLYPTLGPDTITQILTHSEAKLIFVGKLDGYEAMAPGIPADMPRVALPLAPELPADVPTWDDLLTKHEPLQGNPTRSRDELATIVYTSGSTGTPKGVMISFGSMIDAARAVGDHLGLRSDDRMLSYLPLAHVMERWLVECCSLTFGMKLYFAESLTTFVQDLNRASPTLFLSVPRLWLKFQQGVLAKMPAKKLRTLLKIPIVAGIVRKKVLRGLGLGSVRFAGSGSAPIPASLIQWYRDLGLELLEGYGMSENFALSHCSRPGAARVGYVGNTYPAVEHRISEEGEILVKSAGNMMGYYKEPELSKAAFTEDGFLKTGDRGEIDEQGRLKLTGRVKELFKTSKGKYVAPAPIENLIMTHDVVEQACVTGSGFPQPHAVCMLGEGVAGRSREELTKALAAHVEATNARLDHHEQLAFLAVTTDTWQIENGFLTPTMKMKRSVIEETYGPLAEGWYGAKTPVVWQE